MRLFIAVRFPEEIRNEILGIMKDLRAQGLKGNFSREENLHLTLAFLGETKAPRPVSEAMKAVSFKPFYLELKESGTFRDLYWVGLKENKELSEYTKALRQELSGRGIWYDSKPFKPHITIVRKGESEQKVKIRVPEAGFWADKVSLMRSERINGKLTYTEIFSVKAQEQI